MGKTNKKQKQKNDSGLPTLGAQKKKKRERFMIRTNYECIVEYKLYPFVGTLLN